MNAERRTRQVLDAIRRRAALEDEAAAHGKLIGF
jgi:hypothetical protein